MKRFFTFACLGVAGVMMMASNALALDDFSTFTMKGVGNDVDPFELSCKQYNGLDAGTRRLVTAFLEGYAAEGSSTVFVPEAVKNFESGIMVVCAKNPGKTLDGILEEVQYDVPEGGSEPRCSDRKLKTSRSCCCGRRGIWSPSFPRTRKRIRIRPSIRICSGKMWPKCSPSARAAGPTPN